MTPTFILILFIKGSITIDRAFDYQTWNFLDRFIFITLIPFDFSPIIVYKLIAIRGIAATLSRLKSKVGCVSSVFIKWRNFSDSFGFWEWQRTRTPNHICCGKLLH
jgi:hypothetical protein